MKDSYFFIIKKFNSSESITIINALKTDKANLIFDDTGNVAYKEFKYINPLVRGALDYSRTIQDIEELNPDMYTPTSDMLMSQNLQYIMYIKDQIVYILYNPIHRKYLKNYYENIPKEDLGEDGRTFRGKHNVDSVFKTYCETVSDAQTNSYADPTCGCFKSFNTCKQNAFLGGNTVDYSDNPNSDNKNILSAIGNNCVCKAPACQYSGISTGDSFLSKYKNNVSPCEGTLSISYCSTITKAAGNINIADSYLGQECGQTGYEDIIQDELRNDPLQPVKPDDTPSNPFLPPSGNVIDDNNPVFQDTPIIDNSPVFQDTPIIDNSPVFQDTPINGNNTPINGNVDIPDEMPRVDIPPSGETDTPQSTQETSFTNNGFADFFVKNLGIPRNLVWIVYVVLVVLVIVLFIIFTSRRNSIPYPVYY